MFDNIITDLKLEESAGEINALAFVVLGYFGISRTDVISNKPNELDYAKIVPIVSRLNDHEPIQYIFNEAWFCGRKFFVNHSVLIPRPETELVVEEAKKLSPPAPQGGAGLSPLSGIGGSGRILDIGTGSGCIAISLSLEFPEADVLGIDISTDALMVAERNAKELNANVHFIQLDILNQSPKGKFDLIVSNPPYISAQEKSSIHRNVLNHEPHLALFAPTDDPLIFYRAITIAAQQLLNPGGALIVEINERFPKDVCELFNESGLCEIRITKDFSGKPRIVCGLRE